MGWAHLPIGNMQMGIPESMPNHSSVQTKQNLKVMASSQFKVSRRILENVWVHKRLTSKQKSVLWKFSQKANRKQSDFSKQLQHSTKLSMVYGSVCLKRIQHNQISTYLDKQTSLLLLLETRLDVVLIRANFCCTISTARQLITHGKVMVNWSLVNIPSVRVNIGDIVSISVRCLESTKAMIKQNLIDRKINTPKPSHLEINYKLLSAVLLCEPSEIEFPYPIELGII